MKRTTPHRGDRPWLEIAGLSLCLGLFACGGPKGSEETPREEAPAATSDAAAPAAADATSDLVPNPVIAARPPVQAQPRGMAAKAHLVLTGSYKIDADAASANCALFANKTFQVGINVPGAPFFVLRLEKFHGAGTYDGDSRVRANYSGEVIKQSRGVAKTDLTIAPSGGADEVSGSFSGTYKGEAGAGSVSGTFERCRYDLHDTNG